MGMTKRIAEKLLGSGEHKVVSPTIAEIKAGLRERLKNRSAGGLRVLAEACGVTENTVSRWGSLAYAGLPNVWQILKISALAGWSPASTRQRVPASTLRSAASCPWFKASSKRNRFKGCCFILKSILQNYSSAEFIL